LAIYMAISLEGYENVKCFLTFFDKAKRGKIVPPPPITYWDGGSVIFDHLQYKNDGSAKIVKWKFDFKEG
jgi:hypothetical protein